MRIRVRYPSTPWEYPQNVVSVMRPQILNTWLAVKAHYAKRHTHGTAGARNWAAELKRLDAASGYSAALAQVKREAQR